MVWKPFTNNTSNSLGDSGFVVIGPGKVTYRSEMQTHAFNTPYQMSKVPPRMQAQHAIFGGSTHFSETPQDADVTKHKVPPRSPSRASSAPATPTTEPTPTLRRHVASAA